MTEVGNGRRRPRGSLAPEAILAAAVDLIEEHGLPRLTMSALARAMDVPVTSIHWHFRTRDGLIDALAARMTADLYEALPPLAPDRPWDEGLVLAYSALRQQLRKMPAFLQLSVDDSRILARPAVRPRSDARVADEVAMLVKGGISGPDAYRIVHLGSVFVRGFVLLELRAERHYERTGAGLPVPGSSDVTSPPEMYALWGDADAQFQLGLDVFIAGIKATFLRR